MLSRLGLSEASILSGFNNVYVDHKIELRLSRPRFECGQRTAMCTGYISSIMVTWNDPWDVKCMRNSCPGLTCLTCFRFNLYVFIGPLGCQQLNLDGAFQGGKIIEPRLHLGRSFRVFTTFHPCPCFSVTLRAYSSQCLHPF